jgi:hypothetical protein
MGASLDGREHRNPNVRNVLQSLDALIVNSTPDARIAHIYYITHNLCDHRTENHRAKLFPPRKGSAGFANSWNAVIVAFLRRCLAARLFYLTKPRGQVIQRGLSVADWCREYNKMHHSRVRGGRLRVRLNDWAYQYRRQQRNHSH